MISKIDYLGDSIYDIDGKTYGFDGISTNIVQNQDGDTVDRLVRENSDHTCEYHGDDVWNVDSDKDYGSAEMAYLFEKILYSLDKVTATDIVKNYFTPV